MDATRNSTNGFGIMFLSGIILASLVSGCQRTEPTPHIASPTPSLIAAAVVTQQTPSPQTLTPNVAATVTLAPTPGIATATEPSPSARFTFAVIGDTRTQHDVHRSVVARVIELAPDLVLHTGDLVGDGKDPNEWRIFLDIERELIDRSPFYPTLGNHENNASEFFELFDLPGNERWYTFLYGNTRFVCLEIDGFARFDRQSEQYAWLENTLSNHGSTWMVVYFHIPPYSSYAQDSVGLQVRTTLVPLFERYGVDIVFSGHHHNYQRNEVNGVTYIVTGGGGAPLYQITEVQDYTVAHQTAHHAVFVTVANHILTGVAIAPGGEVLDRFVLESS